jgi:steroid Delta-isomerase
MAGNDHKARLGWPDSAYAEDAIFETPAILVTLTDRTQGILRGKSEIRPFFEAGFRKLGDKLSRWPRTGLFFSNGS